MPEVLIKNVPVALWGCRACWKASVYWFSIPSSKVSDTTVVKAIACEFGCSALPARSVEKKFTVVFCLTVNGPAYTVLEVVGVDPSVV